MLTTYLTAILGMAIISGCWLAVQRLWLRHFPQQCAGQQSDALAGRSGCHNCNCKTDNHSQEGS
jgi:hypothetical protein